MDTSKQQRRSANRTAFLLACIALAVYVGFYFLVAN